jgi:hypothetical protein
MIAKVRRRAISPVGVLINRLQLFFRRAGTPPSAADVMCACVLANRLWRETDPVFILFVPPKEAVRNSATHKIRQTDGSGGSHPPRALSEQYSHGRA